MISAFEEGRQAAKNNKNIVLDNPYMIGDNKDEYREQLWDDGFIFEMEQDK